MRKRVTMPVLFVLIAFLIGAGLVVYYNTEVAISEDGDRRGRMQVEVDERAAEGEDTPGDAWEHEEWGDPDRRREARERGDRRGQDGRGEAHDPHDGPRDPHDGHGDNRIPPPPVDDENYDPQMRAMQRSFRLEGDAGPAALPFQPSSLEAELVESDGARARVGQSCEVRLLPVRTRLFNCLVRVVCDGQVLYPNAEQTAGYAPCDVENGVAVRAHDEGHTASDGDPLLDVDMHAGVITISDHGEGVTPFRATLRVGRRLL